MFFIIYLVISTKIAERIIKDSFLLPLPYYRKLMEVLFSVKIFDVEFSPDLYVLRSAESKKVVFRNWSEHMYMCVCVWLQGEYLALYISKTNKDRNTKFYTQYQTSA